MGTCVPGRGIGSDLEDRVIAELGARALPPYPGLGLVPEVAIPAPRPIPPGLADPARVRLLAAAFRSACWLRHALRSPFMLHGRLEVNPAYLTVATAGRKLEALAVPPVAWTLFSFDVWRETVSADGPPPTKWTFSVDRIVSRLGWFERERENYCVRRGRSGPLHQELVRDWVAMWRALRSYNPSTRAEVLAVLDSFFPGDSWEARVIAAKAEVVTLQREVDRLLEVGGDLWA